jgi:hypothetical protein
MVQNVAYPGINALRDALRGHMARDIALRVSIQVRTCPPSVSRVLMRQLAQGVSALSVGTAPALSHLAKSTKTR